MYIESHIIEEKKQDSAKLQWVKPAIDVAMEYVPAEIRTPSSACLRCAYNAYAQNLGCVNEFGFCPYLAR